MKIEQYESLISGGDCYVFLHTTGGRGKYISLYFSDGSKVYFNIKPNDYII